MVEGQTKVEGGEQSPNAVRWALVAISWLLFGCSGISSVFLRNLTHEPVTVELQTLEATEGKSQTKTTRLEVSADSLSTTPLPDAIHMTAKVVSESPIKGKEFVVSSNYDTTSGEDYYVDITDKDIHWSNPTFFESLVFKRFFGFIGVCFGGPLLVVGGLLWMIRRSRARIAPD
jgi:hypothetical protein